MTWLTRAVLADARGSSRVGRFLLPCHTVCVYVRAVCNSAAGLSSQEMVFFRDDILKKMQRHALFPPSDPDMDITEHVR